MGPHAEGTSVHLLSCLFIYTTHSQNAPQPMVSPTLEAVVPSRAVIALANLTRAQHPWLLLCAATALPGAV